MKVVKLSLKYHFNGQSLAYCTLIPKIYGFYTIFFLNKGDNLLLPV